MDPDVIQDWREEISVTMINVSSSRMKEWVRPPWLTILIHCHSTG